MNMFLILAAFVAVTLSQVNAADEFSCGQQSISCLASHSGIVTATTCSAKKPFFDCLLNGDKCTTSLEVYKGHVMTHKYAECGSGAIFMTWSLPVLMFTVAKYFSE